MKISFLNQSVAQGPRSIAFLLTFLLKEGFVLDALRKEVVTNSFVERFQKTFSRKYY